MYSSLVGPGDGFATAVPVDDSDVTTSALRSPGAGCVTVASARTELESEEKGVVGVPLGGLDVPLNEAG